MEVERDRWADYFRSLLALAPRHVVTVEAKSDSGRDCSGPGRRARPLHAITYRPEEDVLMVAAGGAGAARPALRFFVPAPEKIAVTEQEGSWRILIDDASGASTLISVLDPLRAREASGVPHRRPRSRRGRARARASSRRAAPRRGRRGCATSRR